MQNTPHRQLWPYMANTWPLPSSTSEEGLLGSEVQQTGRRLANGCEERTSSELRTEPRTAWTEQDEGSRVSATLAAGTPARPGFVFPLGCLWLLTSRNTGQKYL